MQFLLLKMEDKLHTQRSREGSLFLVKILLPEHFTQSDSELHFSQKLIAEEHKMH